MPIPITGQINNDMYLPTFLSLPLFSQSSSVTNCRNEIEVEIRWRKKDGSGSDWQSAVHKRQRNGAGGEQSIENLDPYTEYTVAVYIINYQDLRSSVSDQIITPEAGRYKD